MSVFLHVNTWHRFYCHVNKQQIITTTQTLTKFPDLLYALRLKCHNKCTKEAPPCHLLIIQRGGRESLKGTFFLCNVWIYMSHIKCSLCECFFDEKLSILSFPMLMISEDYNLKFCIYVYSSLYATMLKFASCSVIAPWYMLACQR